MYSKTYFRLFTDTNTRSVFYHIVDSNIMLEIYQYFDCSKFSKLLNGINKNI